MKKFLLIGAFLLTALPANAKEHTFIGTLQAHEAKIKEADVEPKDLVDVFPLDKDMKINCQYFDEDGKEIYRLNKTNLCRWQIGSSTHLKIRIYNCENKEIDYRAHIYKE